LFGLVVEKRAYHYSLVSGMMLSVEQDVPNHHRRGKECHSSGHQQDWVALPNITGSTGRGAFE